ncbi:MAG: metal-dependent transcriptional regulator, partial [Halobacteriota archaeon]
YKGVTLTPAGDRIALEVIRHHRLIEAYLTEHLDYSISDVHEEADRLEHHISDAFAARVAASLEDPTTDPHGDPIPNEQLELPREPTGHALTEFDEGDVVVVERVSDRDPEVLEYLSAHGIDPGTELTVTEIAPFGMLTVKSAQAVEPVSLPTDVAIHVRVATAGE